MFHLLHGSFLLEFVQYYTATKLSDNIVSLQTPLLPTFCDSLVASYTSSLTALHYVQTRSWPIQACAHWALGAYFYAIKWPKHETDIQSRVLKCMEFCLNIPTYLLGVVLQHSKNSHKLLQIKEFCRKKFVVIVLYTFVHLSSVKYYYVY